MSDGSNVTAPAPVVFAPSQAWDGNNGIWSTFVLRIGAPEQTFKVLPSTMSNEILIPVPEGCLETDPENCGTLRGVYPFQGEYSSGFQYNRSLSWKLIGLYDLALESELNLTGNGIMGFDNVGLQIQNSGGVALTGQVVAGIATKDFYLGLFGLSPKPSNFSDFEHPQPSFMRTLKDKNMIPSLSYAYTAGASYRIPKLPGSLVLGGYDQSRYIPRDDAVSFPFDMDDSKVLSLGIQSITSTNTLKGTVSLLGRPILSLIDSTIPEIWLPESTCNDFEAAFGLTYDPTTDLYLVNETIHSQLTRLNPSITFQLGSSDTDPSTYVNIELPYAAFDLQASYPIYPNSTSYFPLRRAKSPAQYRLGRTFLQEAYIIADYERSNFSVYQARFQSHMPDETIVPILSPLVSTSPTPSPHTTNPRPLGTPTIVGIAVGAISLFTVLLFTLFLLRRRKQRRHAALGLAQDQAARHQQEYYYPGAELDGEGRLEMYQEPGEVIGSKVQHELHAKDRGHMLSDDGAAVHELEVPDKKVFGPVELPVEIRKLVPAVEGKK